MIQPDKPTHAATDEELDEELDDELRDGEETGLDDDESFEPDDDSDLGLDAEDRVIGLDVDTGIEGTPDSEVDDDEEQESWLDGDDGLDVSLTSDDGSDDEDDEVSLGDDTEPLRRNAEDWDNELTFDEAATPAADSGEEGFGEDTAAQEIDLERLPPLDDAARADGEERESDTLTAELLDELSERIDGGDQQETIAPGLQCTRLPASHVTFETLLRLGRPLTALAASGDAGLGWDGSLLVSAGSASPRPERRFVGPDAVFALAALQTESALWVALATPAGLMCSRDGGRTFSSLAASAQPAPDWLASSIAWTRSDAPARSAGVVPVNERGARLWAAAPGGTLYFSDDFGATLQPSTGRDGVLKLQADGANNLVAVCRGAVDSARALRSNDGGASFHALALPVNEVERVQDVQALGGVLLCCRRAPAPQLMWRTAAAGDWQELAAFACAPAALALEDEQACAYFVVQNAQQRWLMRRVLAAHAAPPQIVCDLPADAGAPLQLAVGQHDGATLLQLGSERAWYRVRVRSAGEPA